MNRVAIDWFQIFLLAGLSPFFLFPSVEYTWFYVMILISWLVRGRIKDRLIEGTAIDWPVGLLLAAVAANCFIVPDIELSMPKIAGVIYCVFVYYSIVNLIRTEGLITLGICGYVFGGIGFAIFGTLGMLRGGSKYAAYSKVWDQIEKAIPRHNWKLPGAESGFNPNAVAGLILLFLPLILSLLVNVGVSKGKRFLPKENRLSIVLFSLALVVSCLVLALTQSLGSWLALVITGWIFFLSMRGKAWSVMVVIALMVVFIFIKPSIFSLENVSKGISGFVKREWKDRYPQYLAGIEAVQKNPIFGIGMNRLRLDPRVTFEYSHAHNQLIHTGAEIGITGLVAYVAILIGAARMSWEVWKNSGKDWNKAAVRGLAAGQVALLIFGMGDAIPLGAKTGVMFWISLALIAAMHNIIMREQREKDNRISKSDVNKSR